jgi:SHS2 domain-containing protein
MNIDLNYEKIVNKTFSTYPKTVICTPSVVSIFSYRLLEEIAIADACFELRGKTLEEIFQAGFLALQETSVEPHTLKISMSKTLILENSDIERLLFEFLEELIYLKDAEFLIFKNCKITLERNSSSWQLKAILEGQEFTDEVSTITDVKAITYYQFYVKKKNDQWEARITFDL